MCPIVHMACMHFWHIYVAKVIYVILAYFCRETIYALCQESFCACYSCDGKVYSFCVYTVIMYHNFACNSPPGVPVGRDEISKRETLLFFRCSSWDAVKMYNNPTCGNDRDDFALQFYCIWENLFSQAPAYERSVYKRKINKMKF